MVRPFEIQRVALMEGSHNQLVYRVRRVLFPGSGQSDRALPFFGRPAKDHSGSHHVGGLLRILSRLSPREFEVELYRRILADSRGGLFCIQEVVRRLLRFARNDDALPVRDDGILVCVVAPFLYQAFLLSFTIARS